MKVRGGEYDGATYTDKITVNGSNSKSFKLPYKFSGLTIKVKLFTVPGQVIHNSTRRIVLQGADGVAFIAKLFVGSITRVCELVVGVT